MLVRELSITLRARLTWLQAALTALLVGHGFVLAIDVYSSGSRSVRAHALMAREFDPLLGIVRPTLGGLYLALSLLGPLVAARMLAVEKERHTLHALLLQTGSPGAVLLAKFAAGVVAVGLQLLAPLLLLALFRVLGGHLAWSKEDSTSSTVSAAVCARLLRPGGRHQCERRHQAGVEPIPEERDQTLMRALPASIELEIWLDRDDARRQQLQTDALTKLKLARPDLVVRTPTDELDAPQQGERDRDYGRIVVHVDAQRRETYSTSRRELTTLIFEAAGRPAPSFEQREYPGYPLILEGTRRSVAAWSAYLGLPAVMLLLGWICTRSHRRRT